jgi:hypothetical protein
LIPFTFIASVVANVWIILLHRLEWLYNPTKMIVATKVIHNIYKIERQTMFKISPKHQLLLSMRVIRYGRSPLIDGKSLIIITKKNINKKNGLGNDSPDVMRSKNGSNGCIISPCITIIALKGNR